jgi:ComF family protein
MLRKLIQSRPTQIAVDTVLPPHSLITGQPRTPDEIELWQGLEFIDAPWCQACGFPFEFEVGQNALCARCESKPPAYDRARSAIKYEDGSRKLVLDFKHGGRTDGLKFFAAQMHRAGRELLEAADILIPVPLHKSRLRTRRFNQAALLARALSSTTGIPYDTDTLMRVKNTPSQGVQSYQGRKRNVSGAFALSPKTRPRIKNAHVLLIDDVQTTGSTLESCAKSLKRGGAAHVDALTLMRVVRPVEIPT